MVQRALGWLSLLGPFLSMAGPDCPARARNPREAVEWQPYWSQQSCIFLLITAHLQAGGKCGLGRKGLINKVETGLVTFTSCLSTSYP